ncbi:N-acetylglucosamine kinase [Agromyces soli]
MSGSGELAIDAGQTGTKVRLEREGAPAYTAVLPGVRTHEPLLPQLAEAVHRVRAASGDAPATVSYGVSGLTREGADAAALLRSLEEIGVRRVLLAHDSITSFLGTLGDVRGAVVASGTGVVALAVGRDHVARVDGWGNIMGDAGSAYWIGREALDAGMRAYDGRGPATLIQDLMRERWPDLEEAYIELQTTPDRVRLVASFAEQVAEIARAGDAVADRICLAAAHELTHSVRTALRRVSTPDDDPAEGPVISAIGGVFRSERIRTRFEELVRVAHPAATFEAPHGTGLDGAAELIRLPERHPLRGHVAAAAVEG